MSKTATYALIQSQTLGSATATVTFSSIPGTYTDLVLVMNYAGSIAAEVPAFQVNGDSGSNYSITHLSGNGSTTRSARTTSTPSGYIAFSSAFPQTITANAILNFMDYSNSTTNKTVLIRTNALNGTYNATEANVALWRNTAAITSITLLGTNGAGYYSGSTFRLYGIQAGNA
jgi:hypothetical protein